MGDGVGDSNSRISVAIRECGLAHCCQSTGVGEQPVDGCHDRVGVSSREDRIPAENAFRALGFVSKNKKWNSESRGLFLHAS